MPLPTRARLVFPKSHRRFRAQGSAVLPVSP